MRRSKYDQTLDEMIEQALKELAENAEQGSGPGSSQPLPSVEEQKKLAQAAHEQRGDAGIQVFGGAKWMALALKMRGILDQPYVPYEVGSDGEPEIDIRVQAMIVEMMHLLGQIAHSAAHEVAHMKLRLLLAESKVAHNPDEPLDSEVAAMLRGVLGEAGYTEVKPGVFVHKKGSAGDDQEEQDTG